MSAVLILKLLEVLAPVLVPLMNRYFSRPDAPPTDVVTVESWRAYLRGLRQKDINDIIAEGDAWEAAHPET